jgi:hypothetical protein
VLNAKVQIDEATFHEVVSDMEHVESRRAILFDQMEFWLIGSPSERADSVRKMMWTEERSETALTEFIRVPFQWIELLQAACAMLAVNVVEGGYLGCGAFGRVFRVHRTNDPNKELALKIVIGTENADNLLDEYKILKHAAANCSLHVMGVEAFKYVNFNLGKDTKLGGALLLPHSGKRVKRRSPSKVYKEILHSLFQVHRSGLAHGDPHMNNVVEIDDGSFRWIDFKRRDMTMVLS